MARQALWGLIAILGLCSHATFATEWTFDASQLWQRSTTHRVQQNPNGQSLELSRGDLIADDGPAAGYSYRPNEEPLLENVRLRKQWNVGDPRAHGATLLIGPGGELKVELNGASVDLPLPGKAGNYWQAYEIPVQKLRTGLNDLVVRGKGKVWIAREDEFASGAEAGVQPPDRSAKSVDNGATWSSSQLGPRGDIDGEYYIRLFLDRYRNEGMLELPVIDLGQRADHAIAPALRNPLGPVEITVSGQRPPETKIEIAIRFGDRPDPAQGEWSPWKVLSTDAKAVTPALTRFMQCRLVMTTGNPLVSPSIQSVTVSASPEPASQWQERVVSREVKNPDIVRSSLPFCYERFSESKLGEFRRKFLLDDVVRGARTEWETIERLAAWSATRWERGHLGTIYPKWDALQILSPHEDGTPVGGFCQQYNLVLLQACESLGIPGRCISMSSGDHGVKIRSGHEAIELWSNDFRKWVYVDGNAAWYLKDKKSQTPLSLLELRERQLAAMANQPFEEVDAVVLARTRYEWKGLNDWPAFAELRMIPRSDFLANPTPLPLNQGMRGWFWTGHIAWTDQRYPASSLYGNRESRPGNWNWTLNETRFTLVAEPTAGQVRVHLETVTPGWESYQAAIDGSSWRPVESGFLWTLKAGENRLEVRSRNEAGRLGPVSQIVLVRMP